MSAVQVNWRTGLSVITRRSSGLTAGGLACAAMMGVAIAASAGYDGVYRGTSTLDRGDASVCGKATFPMSVTLVNGQFSIVWDPSRHVGVNLRTETDGSFKGSQMYTNGSTQAQLIASGRIASNALDAHVESPYCARNYHLTKG
jgi:hypothetical protein